MQKLVKLLTKSLYVENVRKNIPEELGCKTEHWMSTEHDERIFDYWRLRNREKIVELKQDDGLKCETGLKKSNASSLS